MRRRVFVTIVSLVVALVAGGAMAYAQDMNAAAQTIFNNGNVDAVQNQPTRATVVTLNRATRITKITTYHYNGGRGAPAGTIALRSRTGGVYGPWQARVDNRMYWVATPGATLPAGVYTVEDSSPATWAQNAASGGSGMAWMEGFAAGDTKADVVPLSPDVVPVTSPSTSKTEPISTRRVLFDGTLDPRWVRHAAAGGNFDRDARLEPGRGLVVRVPQNNGAGNVGLLSPQPLVWLDDFGPAASAAVTFRFDPDQTTGFAVSLAVPTYGGVAGNPPSSPNVLLAWSRALDGASAKLELHVNPHRDGAFRTIKLPPNAPREVTLTLRPREISCRIDGGEPVVDVFPEARANQGFNVYVYSAAPAWQAPVSMALQEVVLNQRRDTAQSPRPESLGTTVLFEGRADPRWEPIGVAGGDFARFARYENGTLVVDVPKGSSWGKTGLLSVKPALHVETQTDIAPYRFVVRADPARTSGFVVAFATTRAPDAWASHLAWVSLIQNERGQYELGLHLSPYLVWNRTLTGRWNGELSILLSTDGVSVSIPGGPTIRAPLSLREGADYYAQVIAHPRQSGAPASLALQTFVRDRVIPADLPSAQRWNVVAPEDFDPRAFLRDLQNDAALQPKRNVLIASGQRAVPNDPKEAAAMTDHLAGRLSNLSYAKLKMFFDSARVNQADAFYGCLCSRLPGVGIGKEYKPNGAPCHLRGYGEWWDPFPTDPKAWTSCLALTAVGDQSFANQVANRIAEGTPDLSAPSSSSTLTPPRSKADVVSDAVSDHIDSFKDRCFGGAPNLSLGSREKYLPALHAPDLVFEDDTPAARETLGARGAGGATVADRTGWGGTLLPDQMLLPFKIPTSSGARGISKSNKSTIWHEATHYIEVQHGDRHTANYEKHLAYRERNTAYLDAAYQALQDIGDAERIIRNKPDGESDKDWEDNKRANGWPVLARMAGRFRDLEAGIATKEALQGKFKPGDIQVWPPDLRELQGWTGVRIRFDDILDHFASGACGEELKAFALNERAKKGG